METAGVVLTSSNGIPIAIIALLSVIILLFLANRGYFSFKGKNISVGRSENEVRLILLKQKEFLLQYFSCLTQKIISDLAKKNIEISYVNTDWVVEKVADEWIGWLLVNNITNDKEYIQLKSIQARLVMLKAIGKVNPQLLQNEGLITFFTKMCDEVTVEIIGGLLNVYKLEKK